MSPFSIIMLCLGVFCLAANVTGWVIMPEKFQFNLFELLGWLFYIVMIICFGVART